ncbi:MAG: phosphoribosyltransferase family protein, partial [Chloroflexota bacterium]
VVYAIPRGGVPVAVEVAGKLGAPLDVVIPRKITVPDNPEAGFGAVTEDGTIVLNEALVRQMELTEPVIQQQAETTRAEVVRRIAAFRAHLPETSVEGKTAIIIDDGLASGYTMVAAVKSMRKRKAAKIVVAVPVASGSAYDLVKKIVDELVCLVVARTYGFAVASFYHHWHDLTDDEVVKFLENWQTAYTKE